MCSCEPGFVCSRCVGTPLDDRYLDDEPRPLTWADYMRVTPEPPPGFEPPEPCLA